MENPLQNQESQPTNHKKQISLKQLRKQIWGAYFVASMAEAITKIQSG